MGEERRRFPRIPLLAEAWITVGERRVHVRTRDLSLGGACVELAPGESLPTQSPCTIEITLPSRAELKIGAQVAWTRAKTAGVRFLKLPDADLAALSTELERQLDELKSLEDEKTPA